MAFKRMNIQDMSAYLLLVVVVAAIAFTLDVISSNVTVEFGTKSYLDATGKAITSIQVIYPLWHQVLALATNFLYGLAAAIFITVFVARKLVEAQQDEQEKELRNLHNAINVNVFDSLFKTIIPHEIFTVIKQEIIENRVLRRDAKWIYSFTLKNGKICCRTTIQYELHNLSQKEVIDPIKLTLDAVGGSEYKILSAECLSKKDDILVYYNPDKPEENKNVDIDDQGNKIHLNYTITIPPKNYVEYKTVFEKSYVGNIVDVQVTKVPLVGADIIVNFPDTYEFDIFSMMSSTPRLITTSSTQKIYRIQGGILPWQGFAFYLTKKANTTLNADPTAAAISDEDSASVPGGSRSG